jgi:hypothetical protein
MMGSHLCDVTSYISINRIEHVCAKTVDAGGRTHDLQLDVADSGCPGQTPFFSNDVFKNCDAVLEVEHRCKSFAADHLSSYDTLWTEQDAQDCVGPHTWCTRASEWMGKVLEEAPECVPGFAGGDPAEIHLPEIRKKKWHCTLAFLDNAVTCDAHMSGDVIGMAVQVDRPYQNPC